MEVIGPTKSLIRRPPEDFLIPSRRADGATLVSLFVALQLVLPARLVISKLPLSLTPASVVALVVGLCWLCAQFTHTLGVAKGRNPVRTMLFLFFCSVLATYGLATLATFLPTNSTRRTMPWR